MGRRPSSAVQYLAAQARRGNREAIVAICDKVRPGTVTELVELIEPNVQQIQPHRFDLLCDLFDAWSCGHELAR